MSQVNHDVIDPVPPAHCRRKQGGQLKTWLAMLKDDHARMSVANIYNLTRWNREWLSLGIL